MDRARALEKLVKFQIADPWQFVRWWVRAAGASGARRIRLAVDDSRRAVELAFDGAAFDPPRADPASCLFDESASPALRHLAWGLLAATRVGADVTVTSGDGAARTRATFTSKGPEIASIDSGESGTLIEAALPAALDSSWVKETIEACRACPAELRIGERVQPPASKADGVFIEKGGRRILLQPGDYQGKAEVYASFYGVRVARLRRDDAAIRVSGFVDDPNFVLDASRANVVRNAALGSAEKAVDAAAQTLVVSLAKTQAERLDGLRRWWAFVRTVQPAASAMVHAPPELPPEILEAVRINDWLAALRRRAMKLPKRVADAVKRAPMPDEE